MFWELDRKKHYRLYQWCYLLGVCFYMLNLGIEEGVVGPTLLGMSRRLRTDVEHISRAFAMKGIGQLIGPPIGGYFKDQFTPYIELFLTCCTVLMATATLAIPYCTSFHMLGVAYALQGLGYSCGATASLAYLVSLYGPACGKAIAFTQAASALGGLLAPPVAAFFYHFAESIEGKSTVICDTALSTTNSGVQQQRFYSEAERINKTFSNRQVAPLMGKAQVTSLGEESVWCGSEGIPETFLLLAGLAFANALLWVGVRFVRPPLHWMLDHIDNYEESDSKGGHKADVTLYFKCYVCFVSLVSVAISAVGFYSLINYVFTISVIKIGMTYLQATRLNTAVYVIIFCGRMAAALVLNFVPLVTVTLSTLTIATILSIILTIWGLESYVTWHAIILTLIFFSSPSYGLLFAYANEFIIVSGKVMAFTEIGLSLGEVALYGVANVFQHYGPQVLLALIAACLFSKMAFAASIIPVNAMGCSHHEPMGAREIHQTRAKSGLDLEGSIESQ